VIGSKNPIKENAYSDVNVDIEKARNEMKSRRKLRSSAGSIHQRLNNVNLEAFSRQSHDNSKAKIDAALS